VFLKFVIVMTKYDAEEKFDAVFSSIRSVMSIAMSVLNSPSLVAVRNFIYRKPSSSLVKNNVFTATSEDHLRLPRQRPFPEVTWHSQSTAAALAIESDSYEITFEVYNIIR